jgi:FAD:protein FMN transferase
VGRSDELWILEKIQGGSSERLGSVEHGSKPAVALRVVGEPALVAEGFALAANGEPRVDGGDRETHVAHVGRGGTDSRVGLARAASERFEGRPESPRERQVVLHFAVADLVFDFDLDLGGEGRRAGAALDGRDDRRHFGHGDRADREFALSALDDDVRCLTAVGHDAVHAHAVAKAEALGVDQSKHVEASRERAPTVPRCEGRVRGSTAERRDDTLRGERRVREHVAVERMEHHRGVDAFERARLEQADLAASVFLGRCPEELDRALDVRGVPREREERTDRRPGDEVVPAGMTDLGQRVVLGKQGDPGSPSRAHAGAEGRLHSAERAFDRDFCHVFDELRDPAARLLFLEAELRMLVDATRKCDQALLDFIHGTIDVSAIERHVGYNSPGPRRRPPLSIFRLSTLLPAVGVTLLALSSADCKKRPINWNTNPLASLDASISDAGLDLSDGGVLLDGGADKKVEARETAMGTSVTFVTFTNDKIDEAGARALFTKALDEIKRLETLLSEWREDSDVGKLNKAEGEWVALAPETVEVMQRAVNAGKLSDGTFDITFHALGDLWKFGDARDAQPKVPKKSDVQSKKKFIDYAKIEIDGQKVRIGKGQKVGLGGIAKGYIVDKAARILKDGGLDAFLVQAGGDLYGSGKKPDGSHWVSGIQDPRGTPGKFFGFIELEDHAFSTAGDYARAFVVDGKRYHHIIDPRTGFPATACRSVTVWAPDALTADTIDDAVFILGPEKGLALVESLDNVGAVIVDASNKVWVSKRLEGKWKQLSQPTDGL